MAIVNISQTELYKVFPKDQNGIYSKSKTFESPNFIQTGIFKRLKYVLSIYKLANLILGP